MTRILYLINSLGRGGAEQLLLGVAKDLDRSRFTAQVAHVATHNPNLIQDLEEAGWPVRHLGGERRDLRWLRDLYDLLRNNQFDIIHCHSPLVASAARILLPHHPRARLLYTEHSEWPVYHPITYWANAVTYWRNDRVLAVSEQAHRAARYPFLLRFLPTPPIETFYHGVDISRLSALRAGASFDRQALGIPATAPVVGTVAHFREEKGHKILVEAAATVRRIHPEVRFVLVGTGPIEGSVKQMVADRGLSDTVIFAGYRSDAALVATMFDIFLLPSLAEGLPIALLECMALGKAVVATRAGGIPEVVEHGQHGLLVPIGDAQALASATIQTLSDPEMRTRMGHESAKRAREFDMRHAVGHLEAIYERESSLRVPSN